jgi:hypothetical protein
MDPEILFQWNGSTVAAEPGDTVASALYRSGVRTFTYSYQYGRPRGLLCLTGSCPNCMVNVDGVPNVRSCTTPARSGLSVLSQNQNVYRGFDSPASNAFLRLPRSPSPSTTTSMPTCNSKWSWLAAASVV